jgi:hypothetical protein
MQLSQGMHLAEFQRSFGANGQVRANCPSEHGKVVKAQQPTIAEFGSPESGPKGTQTWPSRPA